ncbi:MAG: phosphoribosylformylglycinamidine synthase [Lachnospiraceae bacterium]|nr:phosphoribosylformylglycinamidine synthase [Lachnospiraceae bacterium]
MLGSELKEILGLPPIKIRLFNRYDIEGLAKANWLPVIETILSEPACDFYYEEKLPEFPLDTRLLVCEPLPGQFDVRADSCEQCVQMLLGGERPAVRAAKVYAISGAGESDFRKIRSYLINPVESRYITDEKPKTLKRSLKASKAAIPEIGGFADMDKEELEQLRENLLLSMSAGDLLMLRDYFKSEKRNPTFTEVRVIDTYWSDHCRHTTFNTVIEEAEILDGRVKKAYELFLSINENKPATLMRIATAPMKYLKKRGELKMLDESDEINACTIKIKADFKERSEDWLLFFKNETHNHPTEIEPYGGASTCIGGAIRDPLSGRAYVYQAMRITGSGDPRKPLAETMKGKLPQRKLTQTAALGFSAYGNQIGIATGFVRELYHEGYVAKRLEAGAVVGAAPASFVRRLSPEAGDFVVLLGGRTGRDGIGGATGSSKTHGKETVAECASEVQKGNAPEERKLQRLFRNEEVTKMIKRCNDFGAGGVSVAIGELARGVEINLDKIPVKYEGLDGTELCLSESQERMAVVIAPGDFEKLKHCAESENIEASLVAKITDDNRLVMNWQGQKIVDLSRTFLDTNGEKRYASVYVPKQDENARHEKEPHLSLKEQLIGLLSDLNFCSQKGLCERFDSSIGNASVFMPYGGRFALTETQAMAALLPAKNTRTASAMAYCCDPHYTENDPFGGSAYAVVVSVAKLIAAGLALNQIHLTLQEYFPHLGSDKARWGVPFAAMLGAFAAQIGLGVAAIGGKDSMSGSFGDLDVPPTLISFAVGIGNAESLISPEFKAPGNPVYLIHSTGDDYQAMRESFSKYTALVKKGKVLSAYACEYGGIYGAIMKMAFGNMIGFSGPEASFGRMAGAIIFEACAELEDFQLLGYTSDEPTLKFGENTALLLSELRPHYENALEGVFPTKIKQDGDAPVITDKRQSINLAKAKIIVPKVVIPVFPGTNCEYDTALAVEKAGGQASFALVRNLTPDMLKDSIMELEKAIASAQILIFPGGFSGGDEPDGSGKFIVSLFRNQRLFEAVHDLLEKRDGLILGICNGFQALVKLGLLPYGQIKPMDADCPTLTFNHIGRHQSRYITARVSSVISPWLSKCQPGDLYVQPVSHGEGRFVASPDTLKALKANGQICFQYATPAGKPTMEIDFNPNGSAWAVEGITSPCGRILGKMAHTERFGEFVAKNIPGNKNLPLFEGGISYFR